MADNQRKILTSDSTPQGGYKYDDLDVPFNLFASETSAHGRSAAVVPVFTMPSDQSGSIIDCWIGVGLPAVSASGFPAAANGVTVTPRINSNAVMSTVPTLAIAGSAGQAARVNTFQGSAIATAGVVNTASNVVPAGASITVDYNAKSAGSAAATAAGLGLYGSLKIRLYSR